MTNLTPVNKSLPSSKLGPNGLLQAPLLHLMACLASDIDEGANAKTEDALMPSHTMAALSQVIAILIRSCQSQCSLLLQTLMVYPQDASMKEAIVAHSNGLDLFIASHDLLRAVGELARHQWRSITLPLATLAVKTHKRVQGDSAGSLGGGGGGGVGGWLGSAAPDVPESSDETLSLSSSQAHHKLPSQPPMVMAPSQTSQGGGGKGMFNWGKKKNKVTPLAPPLLSQPEAAATVTLSSIDEQQEQPQDSVPQSPAASLDRSNLTALSPGNPSQSLHASWDLVKVLELQQDLLVSVRGSVFGLQKKLVATMVKSIAKAYGGKVPDYWFPRKEPDSPTTGTLDVIKTVLTPLRQCLMEDDQLVHAQSRAFCSQAAWGLVLQALERRVQSGSRRASTISPSLMPLIKKQVQLDCEELKVELGEYQGVGSRRVLNRQTSGLSPGIIAVLNKQIDSISDIVRL